MTRDLALAVQGRERLQRRVPVEPVVLGERRARRSASSASVGPQLPVARVAGRVENRERVGAAGQEDRDEHGLCRPTRRARDAFLERELELAGAVDREREAERARDERAPVEPGAGRQRHARLDRRQPAPRFGGGPAHERGPGELVAVVAAAHEVWRSGDEAISCRSAFSISGGYCSFFHLALRVAERPSREALQLAVRPAGERRGCPRTSTARLRQLGRVVGKLRLVLQDMRLDYPRAIIQRARKVDVSSQRVSSQPADVRRIEELLAGEAHRARPRPRCRCRGRPRRSRPGV